MKNKGWSVYENKGNGYVRIFTGKSFQHACEQYDTLRATNPFADYTINYCHGYREEVI